jgi:hypothetical protein
MPPVPIARYLVPAAERTAPAGFTAVDDALVAGLPHRVSLTEGLNLVLVVPSGLAQAWRDADPAAVVTESGPERASTPTGGPSEGTGHPRRAPARLIVESGGATIASIPLVAGLRRHVPDAGDAELATRIELLVLGWDIRAGSLRGPGDFGSRLTLAWRTADRAGDEFSVPVVPTRVRMRLPQEFRMDTAEPEAPPPGGIPGDIDA